MSEFPMVYVPSKGRPDSKTADLLSASKLPFKMVVEPQEAKQYKNFDCLVLPENNRGIAYVRNWIQENATTEWYWMLDDDITAFYQTVSRKNVKVEASRALEGSFNLFGHLPSVGQASLEYQQFAWSATKTIKFNGYCDVCVCIHRQRTYRCMYRDYVNLKEDRDFTLQVLSSGYRTARVCKFSFAAPKNGSNEGGLKREYDTQGKEALASKRMAELWPGICTPVTKKDGRQDVKINWRAFTVKR